jgi:predicted LPLAT superfamily acyltransferase
MAWCHRVLGRRVCRLLLYPIVAYFFLRERASRGASRRYLERIWAMPEGRRQLHGPPGPFSPFRHYLEFAIQLFDRMVLWGGGLAQFQVEHRGSEHLVALARERRGALLVGAHLGSFDMARELATRHDFTLNVVMFTAHAERINRFFEQRDPASRVRVLQLDPQSVRTAFEIKACLERGELVGMLADRIPAGGRERPIFLEFLGRRAAFPRSPFALACLLGCPVLLSLCVRTGEARYLTFVEPVGAAQRLLRRERDKAVEELAAAWVRRLEENCLRFPYQWFNFFDLWEPSDAS